MPKLNWMRVCVSVAEELSISISVSNSQIQENVVSVWLFTENISQLHTLFIHTSACPFMSTVKPHRKREELREEIKTIWGY